MPENEWLIKKNKPTLAEPVPVKKKSISFGYSPTPEKVDTKESKLVIPIPEDPKKKKGVGKTNNVKSIKVPSLVHSELNLLGTFIDENKTYLILQKLIDSYVKNELTPRQQKQFQFMVQDFKDK